MNNKITQPTAVMFLRARHYENDDEHSRQVEQIAIARQRSLCQQAAKLLGARPIREYTEHGGTGSIDKRPELRLMLEELRVLRDVRYVIVASPDRLARQTADWATINFELEAAGAELITASNVLAHPQRKEATV